MGYMIMIGGLPEKAMIKINGIEPTGIGAMTLYSKDKKDRLNITMYCPFPLLLGETVRIEMDGFGCWNNGEFQATVKGVSANGGTIPNDFTFEFGSEKE